AVERPHRAEDVVVEEDRGAPVGEVAGSERARGPVLLKRLLDRVRSAVAHAVDPPVDGDPFDGVVVLADAGTGGRGRHARERCAGDGDSSGERVKPASRGAHLAPFPRRKSGRQQKTGCSGRSTLVAATSLGLDTESALGGLRVPEKEISSTGALRPGAGVDSHEGHSRLDGTLVARA